MFLIKSFDKEYKSSDISYSNNLILNIFKYIQSRETSRCSAATSMSNYPNHSDHHFLALLGKDDVRAIDILYEEHYDTVVRIAFNVVDDIEVAKDIVQELFLNVWLKRHHLSIKNPLANYLAKAVTNRCLNYLRDNYRSPRIYRHLVIKTEKNAGEESLEQGDLERLVQLSVDSLPPKCKLIFNLSRSREMSYNEIASYLGISKKAVEKQITKALKHLRRNLKPYLSTFLYLAIV